MNRVFDRMSQRALRRLLLVVMGATVVMDLLSLGLALRARAFGAEMYDYVIEGAIGGIVVVAVTVVLVVRRPDHPVTWLFVASATAGSLQQVFGGYAAEALSTGSSLPGGRAALANSSRSSCGEPADRSAAIISRMPSTSRIQNSSV